MLTIAELAEEADVTPRTIRYYVEQGLLPPPGRGRIAEYTREHLERLELIGRLKRHYLPLEEIRDMLMRLTTGEIEELLAHNEPVTEQARDFGSAADYISNVLGQRPQREPRKARQTMVLAEDSPAFIMPPAPPSVAPAAAPMATKAMQPYGPPAGSARESGVDYSQETTTWHRVTVAPGVELHLHAAVGERLRRVMPRIIETLGHILESFPEKDVEEK